MGAQFSRVREAIPVRVLVAVVNSIAIRIFSQRIGTQDVHLNPITEFIPVRVCHFGVGFVDRPRPIPNVLEFLHVQDAVAVGVLEGVDGSITVGIDLKWICLENSQLDPITKPIPIGILFQRIGVIGIEFLQVCQEVGIGVLVSVAGAVPIGILSQWVCAQDIHLNSITQPIVVGVDNIRIGFEFYFLAID